MRDRPRLLAPLLLAAAVLGVLAAPVQAEPASPLQSFNVIKADVSIPWFSSSLVKATWVDSSTYLMRMKDNRWYRAELTRNCANSADRNEPVVVKTDGLGTLDTFSTIGFRSSRVCRIEKIDRISPPARPHE